MKEEIRSEWAYPIHYRMLQVLVEDDGIQSASQWPIGVDCALLSIMEDASTVTVPERFEASEFNCEVVFFET